MCKKCNIFAARFFAAAARFFAAAARFFAAAARFFAAAAAARFFAAAAAAGGAGGESPLGALKANIKETSKVSQLVNSTTKLKRQAASRVS